MVMLSEKPSALRSACLATTMPATPHLFLQGVDALSGTDWSSLCQSHPQAGFFHSREWLKVLVDAYGLKPVGLLWESGGDVAAAVPCLEVPTLGWGRKGVSLPFTDFCEPLVWDEAVRPRVWNDLREWGRQAGWRSIELRGGTELAAGHTPSLSFYGHVLNLDPSEQRAFRKLSDATARGVRKAEREDVRAVVSEGPEGINVYYRLHCQTRRRQGLPPQPARLFQSIFEQVIAKGLGFVVTAFYEDRPIAGAVFFQWGTQALFKFGASERRWQHLRANNLVMWTGIRRLARSGCTSLHLGRTSWNNEGLRRFKRGWGAKEEPIHYYQYDLHRGSFVAVRDRTTGWHNQVFRRMPLWMGRLSGALFYKYLA
jgi:hypothetical protein